MAILTLNQQNKRVEISSFELDNSVVFEFFNKCPASEREDKFHRALYIGVLALMEDRISSFLAKTSNELGTELESLKLLFDMKRELFYKSSVKGILAEDEIAEYLIEFVEQRRLNDKIYLTGNTIGRIPRNKTGDIVCEINGNEDLKIAIECKFDKSVRLGEIQSKDILTRSSDTAWSQLLEAQANRDGKVGIIVFDVSLLDNSIANSVAGVKYIPAVGFIAIIDSTRGDYSNLSIAYALARDMVINTKEMDVDGDILSIIINRVIKDINEVTLIKNLILSNIENNKKILIQLEKSIMLMEFNQRYLSKFLCDGKLSKDDLLDFYAGGDIKDTYKLVEKEIKQSIELL